MTKLTKKEIIAKRQDLVGTGFEYFIDYILDKNIKLSLFHTGNFVFLFNTPFGYRRKNEKGLAEKVDEIIKQENFDLTKYINKKYIQGNNQAQEKAFVIYKKVHEKFNIPYEHLLSSNYLNKD